MTVRYAINDRGELVSSNGRVLGRVVALEIERSPRVRATSDVEETPTSTATATSTSTPQKSKSLQSDARSAATDVVSADVREVWAYWLDRRRPKRTDIEKSQARLIAKGVDATDVATLKHAIDGLLASEWHRDHKLLQLSTILKTKPGGATLRDQIEHFAELASSKPGSTPRTATAQVRIDELKATVLRIASFRELTERDRDELATAVDELRKRGISTTFSDERDGWPTFEDEDAA
jgi:hypothetical protein